MRKNFRYNLTLREISILNEIILGKNNVEIGNTLGLSTHTVKFYISSILNKLCVSSRIQAAVKAVKEELIL